MYEDLVYFVRRHFKLVVVILIGGILVGSYFIANAIVPSVEEIQAEEELASLEEIESTELGMAQVVDLGFCETVSLDMNSRFDDLFIEDCLYFEENLFGSSGLNITNYYSWPDTGFIALESENAIYVRNWIGGLEAIIFPQRLSKGQVSFLQDLPLNYQSSARNPFAYTYWDSSENTRQLYMFSDIVAQKV